MRIERIALRDFRGVSSLDVEFEPAGVTIVEGRNGIGKTSIADAFKMLLDSKDSSAVRSIKEAKPINRDAGPSVEAELTVGPYRLVYRKRWLKEKKTELSVSGPSTEQLSGEDAHNRMVEILERETDTALFDALRWLQGVAISQADLAQAPSLAAALDAAAGGTVTAGGAREDALLDRVEQERLRYFTEKGAVLRARAERAARLDEMHAEVADREEKIRALDVKAARRSEIERELAELKGQTSVVAEEIEECSKSVQAVEEVERSVEGARHEHEQAQSTLREATTARETREGLIEAAASAAKALADLEAEIASAAPALESAREAVAEAETAHSFARADVETAEREVAACRAHAELFDLRLQRDQLRERCERVLAADEALAQAERFLASCSVDEALLAEIDAAAGDLAVAKGRAEAGSPRLRVEALRPLRVTVDGDGRDVVPGAPVEEIVSGEVELIVGDLARVVVRGPSFAGDSAGDPAEALAAAQRRLDDLLRAASVASRAEAHDTLRGRARVESERDGAEQRRTDALRDLSPAELSAKLARAEERLAALAIEPEPSASGGVLSKDAGPSAAEPAASGPASFEDARVLVEEAEARLREARSFAEDRSTALSAARTSLRVLEDSEIERRTRLEDASAKASRSKEELSEHRLANSDEDLEGAVAVVRERAEAAAGGREAAEKALAAADPATARAMLDNASGRQERLRTDIQGREIEDAKTCTQLEDAGHEGLSDRLAETRAKFEQSRREVDSESRLAAAVERLHAVLFAKRSAAQHAYIGPFREKVVAYARILFGPLVDVAVDHRTFEIVSLTLDDTTVPFARLSGGEKEQLAVIARLACGALVAPRSAGGSPNGALGGVPVVIDDALGYSDPDRLLQVCAALGVAGRDCQVIVLTCEPGRYRGVGNAKVVPLG
jgi:AAA domain